MAPEPHGVVVRRIECEPSNMRRTLSAPVCEGRCLTEASWGAHERECSRESFIELVDESGTRDEDWREAWHMELRDEQPFGSVGGVLGRFTHGASPRQKLTARWTGRLADRRDSMPRRFQPESHTGGAGPARAHPE